MSNVKEVSVKQFLDNFIRVFGYEYDNKLHNIHDNELYGVFVCTNNHSDLKWSGKMGRWNFIYEWLQERIITPKEDVVVHAHAIFLLDRHLKPIELVRRVKFHIENGRFRTENNLSAILNENIEIPHLDCYKTI